MIPSRRAGATGTAEVHPLSMERVPDGAVELDFRTNGGIDVSLLWHRATNTLSVLVSDAKTGDRFAVPVRADAALDAFRHPYAYYARGRRIRSTTTRRAA